jgi:hypothetical protein
MKVKVVFKVHKYFLKESGRSRTFLFFIVRAIFKGLLVLSADSHRAKFDNLGSESTGENYRTCSVCYFSFYGVVVTVETLTNCVYTEVEF